MSLGDWSNRKTRREKLRFRDVLYKTLFCFVITIKSSLKSEKSNLETGLHFLSQFNTLNFRDLCVCVCLVNVNFVIIENFLTFL